MSELSLILKRNVKVSFVFAGYVTSYFSMFVLEFVLLQHDKDQQDQETIQVKEEISHQAAQAKSVLSYFLFCSYSFLFFSFDECFDS
jgi:hypothetical protein